MAIIRRITLDILSKNDIKELENDIIKLEGLVKRKDAATRRIEAEQRRTKKQQKKDYFWGSEEALPSNIMRKRRQTAMDRKADADALNSIKSKDQTSKAPFQRNQVFKDLVTRTERLEKGYDKALNDLSKASAIINDPVDFFINMMSNAKLATKIFGAVTVVTILHGIIENKAKELFGPGGPMDVRVLLRNETKSINQLDLLLDIASGKVIYSSDMRTLSRAVSNSSTQHQGENDRFFKERNIGSDLHG